MKQADQIRSLLPATATEIAAELNIGIRQALWALKSLRNNKRPGYGVKRTELRVRWGRDGLVGPAPSIWERA